MANWLKGEATFQDADGETRTVRIDIDLIMQVEDETGAGIMDLAAFNRLGLLASMLRHGLKAAGEERLITRAEAAAILTEAPEARQAVIDAFARAMPEQKAAPEGTGGDVGKAKPKRGTGKRS